MKTINTVSAFASFVAGDIKGGAQAHAYRVAMVRTAIQQGYQGNYSPLTEALALCVGKSAKAGAYAAAFAAAGVVADPMIGVTDRDASLEEQQAAFTGDIVRKLPYAGKLDSKDNKAIRERIAAYTERAVNAFDSAFNDYMVQDKIRGKLERDAKKAEKDVAAEQAAAAALKAATEAASADAFARGQADRDVNVPAVVNAIKTGALDAAEVTALYEAITAHYAAQALAAADAARQARTDAIIDAHEAEMDAALPETVAA